MEEQKTECCNAPVITEFYGEPSIPGCGYFFPICSKCLQPLRDDETKHREREA